MPQGRITALTNAKAHERLGLLRDVAGTSVYEQRRIDSVKLNRETESKKQRIHELVTYINERMETLESEKRELRAYQHSDRERRCIQYALFSQEQQSADRQLEDV